MIEVMEIKDLDAVLALEESLFTSRWTKEQFLYELNENEFSTLYILKENDEVLAYAGLWVLFERAEITVIGVKKECQRRGLGRKMMKFLLRQAVKAECDIVSLEVRPSNEKAINLYHSLGFETIRVRKDYYQDNHEDCLEMMLALGGRNEEDFSD